MNGELNEQQINNILASQAIGRIASLFINDYENFLHLFSELPNTSDLTELNFLMLKNSPSFMIFELEPILAGYTELVEKKSKGEEITEDNTELQHLIDETKLKIQGLKNFLAQQN